MFRFSLSNAAAALHEVSAKQTDEPRISNLLSPWYRAGDMKRISSKRTFYLKRVFPLAWVGVLALIVVMPFVASRGRGSVPVAFVIMPVFMSIIAFVIMKKLVFDLVDEVWDNGDELIVKNKGWEERVALTNIMNVSSSVMTNPRRITLTLRDPGRFGKEVTFTPISDGGFLPHMRSRVADELVERVDSLRHR